MTNVADRWQQVTASYTADIAVVVRTTRHAWAFADLVFLLTALWTVKDWLTSSVNPYPYVLSAATSLSGAVAYIGYTAVKPRLSSFPLVVTLLVALAYLTYDTSAVSLVTAAATYTTLWMIGRCVKARCVALAMSIVLSELVVAYALVRCGVLSVSASDAFDPWLGNGVGASNDMMLSAASRIAFDVGIPDLLLIALLLVFVVGLGVVCTLQEQGQLERDSRPSMARASVAALIGILMGIVYGSRSEIPAESVFAVVSWIAVAGVLAAVKPAALVSERQRAAPPQSRNAALAVAMVILLASLIWVNVAMRHLVVPLTTGAWGRAAGRVSLCQISQPMQDATVAMEDGHFYGHHGFDWIAMHRALRADLRAGQVEQGGSTITQQLAKNLFLTDDRTVTRKVEEAAYTLELEHDLSKWRILELYLNEIDYGCGQHGIAAAAAYYFHEVPEQLTLAQSAVLVGLVPDPPRTPGELDPARLSQGQQTALSRVAFFFPRRYRPADIATASSASLDHLVYPYKDAWDRGATDTIPGVWHGVGFYFFADPDEPGEIDHVSPSLKPALAAFLEDAKKSFGLTGIDHLGVYNDRPMRQSRSALSAHAFGQAIDVSGFRFAHGSELLVANHVDPKVAARLAPIEALLRRHFPVVVDWRDDPLRHQTHFHCEVRGPRPGSPTAQPPGVAVYISASGPDAPPAPDAPNAGPKPVQRLSLWEQGKLVRQTTGTSCGPASLATVLTYYLGRPTRDDEMIDDSHTRGQYTSAQDLERACQAIGYQAVSLPATTLPQLLHQVQANNVPVVVLWTQGDGHWVVLVGQQGGDVLVSNPNHGNVRMTEADFNRHWAGGDVLLIRPPD